MIRKLSWWGVWLTLLSVCGCPAQGQTQAPGTAVIQWTAVGDDGLVGRASYYDIQFKRVSQAAWTATRSSLVPQPAGTVEQFQFATLDPDTAYNARVRACDEVGNCAPNYSNIVTFTAGPAFPRDSIPPGTINLTVPTGADMSESQRLRIQEWFVRSPDVFAIKP